MSFRILSQRLLHLLTSTLAILAQRLPFLKHLSPLASSPVTLRFAAPITTTFIGTQSLSGQSVIVEPSGDFLNPASGKVGEQFTWAFGITDGHNAGSCSITGLPPGLEHGFDLATKLGFIAGTPTEAGEFVAKITVWRRLNQSGDATPVYDLPITITAAEIPDPFVTWRELHWTGEDATNDDISGPHIDSDEDGMNNLLEFFLDLNPTEAESIPGNLITDPEDSAKLLYTLPFNADAGRTGFKFQRSTSLKQEDWQDISEDDNYEIISTANTITLRFTKVPRGEFIRLVVTL